jgi:hypothetical protein
MRASWALISGLLLLPSAASAQAPALLPVQGVLSDADGTPLDGQVAVTFTLYDALAAGNVLHQEQQVVTVESGLFTVYLGSGTTTLDLSIFQMPDVWLGVAVESDPEMTPRFRIGTAPYSAYAQYCGDANLLGGLAPGDFADAAHTHDFAALTSVPAGLADGDDVGFSSEAELTALLDDDYAAAAHTHAWAAIAGVPADLADGDDDTTYSAGAGLNLNAAGQFSVTGVTSALITDLTIATADLANNAVTTAKIADGTITGADISQLTEITATDFAYRNPVAGSFYVDPTSCHRAGNNTNPSDRVQTLHMPSNIYGPALRIEPTSPATTYDFYCPVQLPAHGNVVITGAALAWFEANTGTNCLVGADIRHKGWGAASFGAILSTVYDGADGADFAYVGGGTKPFPAFTYTVPAGQIVWVRPFIISNASPFGDCRFVGVRIDYTVDRP